MSTLTRNVETNVLDQLGTSTNGSSVQAPLSCAPLIFSVCFRSSNFRYFFTQKQIRKSGWVAKNCLDVILILHKNWVVGILFAHLVRGSIQNDRCAKFCWFLFDQSVHHVTTATWISVNVDWFLFEQLRRRQRCLVPNEISTGIEDKTRPGPTDIFPVFSCTWKASQIPWTRLETFSIGHRNVESLAGSYLIADFTVGF